MILLQGYAGRLKTVAALMQKLHPGERYYLTNIQASQLKPDDVREWSDDLWLFPYYTDRKFVPFDARPGGAAATAWPAALQDEGDTSDEAKGHRRPPASGRGRSPLPPACW